MSTDNSLRRRFEQADAADLTRAGVCVAITLAVAGFFAAAPPRDPSKVVSGLPCSVLSEQAIGNALGTTVQLMPTSGTVCQYVATEGDVPRSVFVVAHRDSASPSAASSSGGSLSVRSGAHAYTVTIVQPSSDPQQIRADELRLARMMPHAVVAQRS